MTPAGSPPRADLRKYRVEGFQAGPVQFEIRLPPSVDELIDLSDANTDERMPYWAELWPAARGLSQYLAAIDPVPASAVEIGSGVALPSMVLASRGVAVTALDYYADALDFAGFNARENGVSGIDFRLVDFRDLPDDLPTAPLVLAADVLYEERNVEPVLRTISELTAPGGRCLLADPGRRWLPEFVHLAGETGWSPTVIEEFDVETVAKRPSRIQILELRPPHSPK